MTVASEQQQRPEVASRGFYFILQPLRTRQIKGVAVCTQSTARRNHSGSPYDLESHAKPCEAF